MKAVPDKIIIFNVISIVLGIGALAIPVVVTFKKGRCSCRPCVLSLSTYILALVFQFFQIAERAELQDWAGIADTIDAVSFIAVVFAAVIISLNVILIKIKG